jgi:hypothetical protein
LSPQPEGQSKVTNCEREVVSKEPKMPTIRLGLPDRESR